MLNAVIQFTSFVNYSFDSGTEYCFCRFALNSFRNFKRNKTKPIFVY